MAALNVLRRPLSAIQEFLRDTSNGGKVLIAASALAMALANSPAGKAYFAFLDLHVLGWSILHAVNDGLMSLFFLLVGLEIKREAVEGELSTWGQRALPALAALGGMIVPALVYVAVNADSSATLRGWAIPTATDIAFALAVLSLLGPRVPLSLSILLASLAIVDDLGAVLVIALFYTSGIDALALASAGAVFAALCLLNLIGVRRLVPYLGLGAGLWVLVMRAGIHPTIAGVLLATTIPLKARDAAEDGAHAPLHRLEHGLQRFVPFVVVPLFGFANAGLDLSLLSLADLSKPVTVGVALGLFLGKQAGVMLFVWAAIRTGIARMPARANWRQVYGVALLCGIGFTMALFINLLAFPDSGHVLEAKLGVLLGSFAAAMAGAAVLRSCPVVQENYND